MDIPITERSNLITSNIDVVDPTDMVQILSKCDDQIFDGYDGSMGVFDKQILSKLEKVSQIAITMLCKPDVNAIVLSGCGTSGRLAFMVATNFNLKLKSIGKSPCFHYLIAGEDTALFTSQEAIEDDPKSGMEALKEVIEDKERVLYIGITCGFSAPYVGGQLEYAMEHLDQIVPVLIGFNKVQQARNLPVEKWGNTTFHDVIGRLEEVQAANNAFIINPIVGPEPVTGSSRMKGGSTTKILLDVAFTSALTSIYSMDFQTLQHQPSIEKLLRTYMIIKHFSYKTADTIAQSINIAGKSLAKDGHLLYISDTRCGVAGLIDASECPPTFGSTLDDVRGFIKDGYNSLQNKEGQLEKLFDISTEYFTKEIMPNLKENDVVIILQGCELKPLLQSHSAKIITVEVREELDKKISTQKSINNEKSVTLNVNLPRHQLDNLIGKDYVEFIWPFIVEIALKWVCNCVSTGAHIIKGKIYQNYMVDVKVSNNKLYHRALSIVQTFADVQHEFAKQCLLKAIYGRDDVTMELYNAPISCHVDVATPKHGVVPMAIILCKMKCSYQRAVAVLQEYPIVRQALTKLK